MANKYLGILSDLKIVVREIPVTEEKPLKSKRGLYRIADEFIRFWFKFIFPWRAEIEIGRAENVLDRIKAGMPQYLSYVYEKVATETIWKNMERFFPFASVGRWWERNEEIDIVGINSEINSILLGEVKWSEKPVGTNIYEELREKAQKLQWGRPGRKENFCLFSRKGFTEAMLKRAKEERVVLFKGNVPLEIK